MDSKCAFIAVATSFALVDLSYGMSGPTTTATREPARPVSIQPAPPLSPDARPAASDAQPSSLADLFGKRRRDPNLPKIQPAPPRTIRRTIPSVESLQARFIHYMHSLHNDERSRRKLPLLAMNDSLSHVAERYAKFLSDSGGKLSHTADGVLPDRLARVGYRWTNCGENLFNSIAVDCEAIFGAWMTSSAHQANIINGRFGECGIARHGFIWVVIFASPGS